MTFELPNKLYFKIGEVAKFADVAPHVIRYWESEFDAIKPKRANSKQRLFRKEDVILILQIKDLLHNQGFTVAGAKKYLLLNKQEKSRPACAPAVNKSPGTKRPEEGLKQVKQQLLHIQEILKRQV